MASRQLMRILRRGYSTVKSDPYKILGLTQGATRQDVKKAFYKLAKIFHPDIDPSKTAHFMEINRAYQELRTKARFPRIHVPKMEKMDLELTQAEAMQGCRKKVILTRELVCQRCVGLGCDWCMHRGVILERTHVQLLVPTGTVDGSKVRYTLSDSDKLLITFHVKNLGFSMDHGLRHRIFVRSQPVMTSPNSWLGRVMRFVRGS